MRVLDWIRELHQRDDAKALERADNMAVETPAEREISEGDFEGMKADLMAGEVMYEVGLGEAERLAEGE